MLRYFILAWVSRDYIQFRKSDIEGTELQKQQERADKLATVYPYANSDDDGDDGTHTHTVVDSI